MVDTNAPIGYYVQDNHEHKYVSEFKTNREAFNECFKLEPKLPNGQTSWRYTVVPKRPHEAN